MNKILVTGAGVDKTDGINFPLANKLLPEVAQFIINEGKEFEAALRTGIPGLRFNFSRFINHEIDALTSMDVSQLKQIVESVQNAISLITEPEDISRKRGIVIVKLFNKLMQIQESSQIDDDTFELLKDAFGNDYTESDFVIDIHKMSLSDTFKSILKLTLRESLTANSNPISDAISSKMLNIEQLLIQKFLGFYNNNANDVKNYIYISWCLWAYLVHKQKTLLSEKSCAELPFYSVLPKDITAITLNYTTFLEHCGLNKVIYFHGGLAEYVRMDTRQLLPIENITTLNLVEFVTQNVTPNLDFASDNPEKHQHVIPSLVPPLKLKPILSQKYIELWSDAGAVIKTADIVVVVGYSFNNADEHFNDIVRNNDIAKFAVVAPDATSVYFIERMEKVFGISKGNLSFRTIQGIQCKTCRKLLLIPARADEINLSDLFAVLASKTH